MFLPNKKEVKTFLERELPTKAFFVDNNRTYLAKSSKVGNEISYTLCKEASIEISITNAIKLIDHNECIVVNSSDDDLIGFINYETLSKALLFNYKRLQAYLHTILDTIDESCTVIDHEEKVVFWTKGAEEIFSVSESEII